MKRSLYISGLALLVISGISCNDDFLSKNNVNLYELYDTLKLNNYQTDVETILFLGSLLTSDYTIVLQPKWLKFNSMHGEVTGGTVPLSFSIVKDDMTAALQTYYGKVALDVENI